MARKILNHLTAALALALGCAGAAQAPSNAQVVERLVSPSVEVAPKLSLEAERKLPPNVGAKTKVSLQSVHAGSKVRPRPLPACTSRSRSS